MSNYKTLADVQPGGRVRLGDQAERARFEAWLATQHDQGSEHVMATVSATDDRYQSPVTSSMWSAWQAANSAREGGRINGWKVVDGVRVYSAYAHASILDDQQYVRYEDYLAALSAQPSPGGQGGLNYERMFVDACAALAEVSRELGCDPEQGGAEPILAAIAELREALAARQPVGQEPDAWIPANFFDKGTVAMTARRAPPSAMAVELYGEYVPLFRSPAQAVDLVQFRPAVCAMGLYAEEPEDVDEAKRLLALIDGKAVGNG